MADPTTITLTTGLDSNGNAVEGKPLTVTVDDADHDVPSSGVTYLWETSTNGGATWSQVALDTGGSSDTYTPTETEEGLTTQIRVTASYTDEGPQGATQVVATSIVDAVPKITNINFNADRREGQLNSVVATLSEADDTVTYAWVRDDNVTVSTASSYRNQEADEGHRIDVFVTDTADNGGGSTTQDVFHYTVIDLSPSITVSIGGIAAVGQKLSAVVNGAEADDALTYAWVSNGTLVGSSPTYIVAPADLHQQITLTVTDTIESGIGLPAYDTTSASAAITVDPPTVTLTPGGLDSNGNAVEGNHLTVTVDDTDHDVPSSGVTYLWETSTDGGVTWNQVALDTGGTSDSYTPSETDEGLNTRIRVTASYADEGNQSATQVLATSIVDAVPKITNINFTADRRDRQLNSVVPTLSEADDTVTYAWVRDDNVTLSTTSSYRNQEADEGHRIDVLVTDTADNGGGTTTQDVFHYTVIDLSPSITVSIGGTAAVGQTLSAVVNGAEADDTLTYAWVSNGTTVGTGPTYSVARSDLGRQITLTVTDTIDSGIGIPAYDTTRASAVSATVTNNPGYDFNGDTVSDLVFQNEGATAGANAGTPQIWLWNGTSVTSQTTFSNPGASWHVVASRDMNGDGKADLIWQNSDGTPGVWLMNGATPLAEAGLTNPGSSWHIVASGDLNLDGNADFVWQSTDGTLGVWLMNGTTPSAEAGLSNPGANWKVIGAADFNADGRDDILLQNTATGNLMIDLMNGASVASTVSIAVGDPSWHAVSTGVFNGVTEIAWQNSDGTPAVWLMNGTTPAAEAALPNPGAAWQVISLDHFTSNGQADLLFQNTNGAIGLWGLNGTSVAFEVGLPNPGAGWQSQNGHPFAAG